MNLSYPVLFFFQVEHRLDSIPNIKRAWKHTLDTFSRKYREEVAKSKEDPTKSKSEDQIQAEVDKDCIDKKGWPFYQPLMWVQLQSVSFHCIFIWQQFKYENSTLSIGVSAIAR